MIFKLEDVLNQLQMSLEHDKLDEAIALIESLRSPDQAEVFAELEEHEQTALLPRLNPSDWRISSRNWTSRTLQNWSPGCQPLR